MKKRILSILLLCCMVLTLLPTAAFAAGNEGAPAQALASVNITFPMPAAGKPAGDGSAVSTGDDTGLTLYLFGPTLWQQNGDHKKLKPEDLYEANSTYLLNFTFYTQKPITADTSLTFNGQPVTLYTEYEAFEEAVSAYDGISSANLAFVMFSEDGIGDPSLAEVKNVYIVGLYAFVRIPKALTTQAVSTAEELTAALSGTADSVKLTKNIDISNTLTVTRTVTLDLNGKVLRMTGSGSVIAVEMGGNLTIRDSGQTAEHRFTPNSDGLWVLDEENGTETVTGGVITGGTGTQMDEYYHGGGGVYVAAGGRLTMTGGNIVGCSAKDMGGGVYFCGQGTGDGQPAFKMTGGSIAGCLAIDSGLENAGGGVCISNGIFVMEGGSIIECIAFSTTSDQANGGGVHLWGESSFTMSDGEIKGCKCSTHNWSRGGGVYIGIDSVFTMNGGSIKECTTIDSPKGDPRWPGEVWGGGVYIHNGTFTMNDGIIEDSCEADYDRGGVCNDGGTLNANGGEIACDVMNGVPNANAKITGKGGTKFSGKVTNGKDDYNKGTIESGTFTGEVINDGGVITNGTFTGPVINNGEITGGTFNGGITGTPALATGSGTESAPYQISTADGLKWFRDVVNGTNGQTQNTGVCAVLMNDIVLNDGTFDENGNYTHGSSGKAVEEWTPIGKYKNDSENTPYTGTFDGQGHTIKGLYINLKSDVYVGLFGCLKGAAVRNLTVDGYVQSFDSVGGIAGKAKANGLTPSTIENCRNNCRVVGKADGSSFLQAGGIVAYAEDTTISGCVNTGVVEASGSNNFSSEAAGIVNGLDKNATVKNCYNTGEIKITGNRLSMSFAGGIVSCAQDTGNISDCYNVGAVTVSYTGSEGDYTAMVGGIVGNTYNTGNTASNCYSVGTLMSAGTGTSYVGGVVGRKYRDYGTVENCYYLDSTAEKAIGNNDGTADEATGPKTAAQFGDGTVLTLLTNGRADSEHPWNSQCQYLAAVGRTLPVFKTQTGDAHTHNWSAWTHMEGTEAHRRSCTTCNAVETVRCSGGAATCTAKAVCAVCGAEYGDIDPNHHGGKLKHVEAKDATTATEGNIEYWYCEACDKYYSDEGTKNEILQSETVIPRRQSSSGSSGGSSTYPISAPGKSENGNVSVSPKNASKGSTVTITVTPDSGYVLETISVTDKNGNDLKLTDKGNGKYTFTMPGSKVEIKAAFMEDNSVLNFFYDVPNDAYYYEAVKWAVENGITGGIGNSLFAPDRPCTRAQIVTFLWRASGSPVVNYAMDMTDVAESAYYAEAVRWALSQGITTGTGDGTFSPDAACTRAQAVAFLFRAAVANGLEAVTLQDLISGFEDAASVPGYAVPAMNWALSQGIMKGSGAQLLPGGTCTRAQIVTFLYRAYQGG